MVTEIGLVNLSGKKKTKQKVKKQEEIGRDKDQDWREIKMIGERATRICYIHACNCPRTKLINRK